MKRKTGGSAKSVTLELGRSEANRVIDTLNGRGAGLAGARSRSSFARKGFGNLGRGELGGGFGRPGLLGRVVPREVKAVPTILGTVVGVGFNSAASRLLESPKIGIQANPLLSRVGLLAAGIIAHVFIKADFTLGFLVGQVPGLIDAGVTALMDMALGEPAALQGMRGNLEDVSREALAELKELRRQLDRPSAEGAGPLPTGVRTARAAA